MASNTQSTEETRARILDAAMEVFAEKGYHDARVDEIVTLSGSSKGGVYFHFSSKREIFMALIDEFAANLAAEFALAVSVQDSGITQVDAALRACLTTFERYRRLAKIFLIQAAGIGPDFEHKRLEIHDRFVLAIKSYLDIAVAEGDIAPLDTEVVALAWMGAINEAVTRWVVTGSPSPERILATLRTVLLQSIGVPEAHIHALNGEVRHD